MYDPAALDDEDFDEMAPEARQEAERLMRKRDREEAAARGRLHRGLLYGKDKIICFVLLFFFYNERELYCSLSHKATEEVKKPRMLF